MKTPYITSRNIHRAALALTAWWKKVASRRGVARAPAEEGADLGAEGVAGSRDQRDGAAYLGPLGRRGDGPVGGGRACDRQGRCNRCKVFHEFRPLRVLGWSRLRRMSTLNL